MTLVLELTEPEEARLAALARSKGLSTGEAAQRLLAEHLPPVNGGSADPTLALFASWHEEDARMTDEESSEEQHLWDAFESGITETRRALGMRIV